MIAGEVDRIEGPRSTVVVYEQRGHRCLCFADNPRLTQGAMSLERPLAWRSEYVGAMLAALAAVPAPRRLLLLGLGSGALARLAEAACPGVEVDVVEVDPSVIEAAVRWFGVAAGDRLRIHLADAAGFLRAADEAGARYDLAWVDCFDSTGVPPTCATPDFHERAARVAGVVVANLVGTHRNALDLAAGWRKVLRRPWRIQGRRSTNHVLFGRADRPLPLPATLDRADALDARLPTPIGLRALLCRATPLTM